MPPPVVAVALRVSGDFLPELLGMPAARPVGMRVLCDVDDAKGCYAIWIGAPGWPSGGDTCTEECDLRKLPCEAKYYYCYKCSFALGLKNWNKYL